MRRTERNVVVEGVAMWMGSRSPRGRARRAKAKAYAGRPKRKIRMFDRRAGAAAPKEGRAATRSISHERKGDRFLSIPLAWPSDAGIMGEGSRHADRSPADLALAARMLEALRAGQDLRQRKVRRLRATLRMRTYENPLKLEVALDRLVADINSSPLPPESPEE